MKKIGKVMLLQLILLVTLVGGQTPDSGPDLTNKAIKRVAPVYPPLAKRKHLQGSVIVKLHLNTEGEVIKAEFVAGNSLFKPASLEAAKQWEFSKAPTNITGHISFKFELKE